MALTTVARIEQIGALIPQLFDLDQTGLDALVTDAQSDANAWLQVYLGDFYGGATASETLIQARAEAYLTMAFLTPLLRAKKVYGTHFPLDSEDAAAYEDLLEKDWEGMARSLLNKWITTELEIGGGGKMENFALPYFAAVDSPDATTTDDNDLQLRELADAARSRAEVDFSTVS